MIERSENTRRAPSWTDGVNRSVRWLPLLLVLAACGPPLDDFPELAPLESLRALPDGVAPEPGEMVLRVVPDRTAGELTVYAINDSRDFLKLSPNSFLGDMEPELETPDGWVPARERWMETCGTASLYRDVIVPPGWYRAWTIPDRGSARGRLRLKEEESRLVTDPFEGSYSPARMEAAPHDHLAEPATLEAEVTRLIGLPPQALFTEEHPWRRLLDLLTRPPGHVDLSEQRLAVLGSHDHPLRGLLLAELPRVTNDEADLLRGHLELDEDPHRSEVHRLVDFRVDDPPTPSRRAR